jgi:hypothetical protein
MRSQSRSARGALVAVAVVLGLVVAGCTSGDRPTLPTLPSTTTTEGGSTTTTTDRPTTTTTERPTTTTTSDSTTTSSTGSSTTTSTTEAPTTTTTRESTTTTRESTTTTRAETTTTTVPATVPASGGSSSSPWLWIGAAALLVLAAAIAVLAVVRSRAGARKRWAASGRDLARRAERTAGTLDQAAAVIAGPVGADRQVWLDSANALEGLAATATSLAPDAPAVPGEPKGTNSLVAALGRLQTSLTVCRSAAADAERTRFELINPTTEQLDFASHSVRQACAAVVADTHTLHVALDKVDPPAARTA